MKNNEERVKAYLFGIEIGTCKYQNDEVDDLIYFNRFEPDQKLIKVSRKFFDHAYFDTFEGTLRLFIHTQLAHLVEIETLIFKTPNNTRKDATIFGVRIGTSEGFCCEESPHGLMKRFKELQPNRKFIKMGYPNYTERMNACYYTKLQIFSVRDRDDEIVADFLVETNHATGKVMLRPINTGEKE